MKTSKCDSLGLIHLPLEHSPWLQAYHLLLLPTQSRCHLRAHELTVFALDLSHRRHLPDSFASAALVVIVAATAVFIGLCITCRLLFNSQRFKSKFQNSKGQSSNQQQQLFQDIHRLHELLSKMVEIRQVSLQGTLGGPPHQPWHRYRLVPTDTDNRYPDRRRRHRCRPG